MLCQYRHVFGAERTGFHSYRLFDVAVGDLLLTILLAVIISYSFNINFYITLILTLVVGVLVHRLFCVNTKINTIVFGKIK